MLLFEVPQLYSFSGQCRRIVLATSYLRLVVLGGGENVNLLKVFGLARMPHEVGFGQSDVSFTSGSALLITNILMPILNLWSKILMQAHTAGLIHESLVLSASRLLVELLRLCCHVMFSINFQGAFESV